MTPSYTRPQLSLPGIRDPRRDYPFENLSVQCGTTPSNFNTSIQRPLARQRVMLSRRVIAYYGLIRVSESLPATYGFAAESAAPKEIGLRWESRGSPIYSAGLCSRAASLTPVSRRKCRFQSERVPLWETSGYQRSGCGAIRLTTLRDRTSSSAWLAPAPWLWGGNEREVLTHPERLILTHLVLQDSRSGQGRQFRFTPPFGSSWTSSTRESGSSRRSSRRSGNDASGGPKAPRSSARPGRSGSTR